MIIGFRHKGLATYYQNGNKAGINPRHEKRIRLILGRLDACREPRDMNLPGLRLHSLTGNYDGYWSVDVSGNWRIIFRFEAADVTDVDYLDYH